MVSPFGRVSLVGKKGGNHTAPPFSLSTLPGLVAGRSAFSLDGGVRRIGRNTYVHTADVAGRRGHRRIGGLGLPTSRVDVRHGHGVVRARGERQAACTSQTVGLGIDGTVA